MKRNHLIYILLAAFNFLAACEKNEQDPAYKGEPGLVIGGLEAEGASGSALSYSFAISPSAVTKDTLSLMVQTIGNVSDVDRSFSIAIDTNRTNALAGEYQLPKTFVMPAGQFKQTLPLVLNRASRLKDTSTTLSLVVVENENFKPGPYLGGVANMGPQFTVTWSDRLTKPSYWDNAGTGMIYTAGKWSRVKHQLLIDASGYAEYSTLDFTVKYYIAGVAAEYLQKLNAASGTPLKNETDVVISICSQCN
ncbi:DUF4843 domain-containing protein [Chitinophaga horti]|uniref:DUF4843 domain-containing protein n=1 Tax=Chitinophaga horti TaxID=2920382 RepID=A0ABY6JB50_9BACT|nr:DUF4843 domain-containing protein [Chitinophaga horti]UYQ95797.1 DUF4843 domain-containing protein [Chitinophaga horti]